MAENLHMIAYFENQDGGGTIQRLAALADGTNTLTQIGVDADAHRIPDGYTDIVGIYCGIDPTVEARVQLEANSFLSTYGKQFVEIPDINATVEPGSNAIWYDCRANPIKVKSGENLFARTLNNPGAATDQFIVLVLSKGGLRPANPAGAFWMRADLDAAAVTANGWTNIDIDEDDFIEQLGEHTYEVYDAVIVSTSVVGAGLAFHGESATQPIIVKDDIEDITAEAFRTYGSWGVKGVFDARRRPRVRILCDLADNEAQPIWFLVKKR